jgi:hypothetical protein
MQAQHVSTQENKTWLFHAHSSLKSYLPGLNALFGLEYKRYGEEHKELYETETSERSFEEETKLSGFSAAPVKNEGKPSLMTMLKKLLLLDTIIKLLLLAFQLNRRSCRR